MEQRVHRRLQSRLRTCCAIRSATGWNAQVPPGFCLTSGVGERAGIDKLGHQILPAFELDRIVNRKDVRMEAVY